MILSSTPKVMHTHSPFHFSRHPTIMIIIIRWLSIPSIFYLRQQAFRSIERVPFQIDKDEAAICFVDDLKR